MPIVNGRVHVRRRSVPTHHRALYVAGVAFAVLIVAAGWVLTVGNHVQTLFAGVQNSVNDASATLAQAQADAARGDGQPQGVAPTATETNNASAPTAPAPAAFIPALRAAITAHDASSR